MANKIDGEDIYQIGINELAEKSSVDATDVVAIQQSVGGVVQKKSVGAIVEKAQAQADWNEADNTKADYIKNKPTIPAAQIQSDWNQGDNTKLDFIKNKPTIPSVGNREIEIQKNGTKVDSFTTNESGSTKKTINITVPTTAADVHALPDTTVIPDAQIQSDWNQSDNTKKDYIKNKPTIPAAQIQSDWTQADNTKLDFIKNKPSIPTVNNSTITITQGGVTKGTFNLNQSSAETIALDAGGGASIVFVDTISNDIETYLGVSSLITLGENKVYDITGGCFYTFDGVDWTAGDTPSDGTIIYTVAEEAFYIYENSEIKAISRGKSLWENGYNDGSWIFNAHLPQCDSNTVYELTSVNTTQSAYYLQLYDMSTADIDSFANCLMGVHTIIFKNTKSSDVDFTVTGVGFDTEGAGFIASGLDSNNSFTVKAGEMVEMNVLFSDYVANGYGVPIIIVKDGYSINIS